jgi:hypothetical protein
MTKHNTSLLHKPAQGWLHAQLGGLSNLIIFFCSLKLYFTLPHLSLRTLCGLCVSVGSPHGVRMESAQSLHRVHGLGQIVNKKNKNIVRADSLRTMNNERKEKVLFN